MTREGFINVGRAWIDGHRGADLCRCLPLPAPVVRLALRGRR